MATQCGVASSPKRSPRTSPLVQLHRRKTTLRMLLSRGRSPPGPSRVLESGNKVRGGTHIEGLVCVIAIFESEAEDRTRSKIGLQPKELLQRKFAEGSWGGLKEPGRQEFFNGLIGLPISPLSRIWAATKVPLVLDRAWAQTIIILSLQHKW
ncbi:hypothetical protein HS088_TW22G01437 [Tripterygium wilfordii]|uniref:Uncharacterized protein n=1 Tax=Tripterygium wilfordii TaxID=458696 RepID=A0A7J7C0Q6_TRIWF|nr:hypothetical protein HS088_TW22G01437 [Tripterygium wilfordii]